MTRVVDGERGSRRVGVEVLSKRVGGDGLVVRGNEVIEFDGEQI